MLPTSLSYGCQVSVPLNCLSIPFTRVPIIFHLLAPIISTNLGAYVEVLALGHRQRAGDRQRGSDRNKSHEDAGFLKYFKVCHFFSVIMTQIQTPSHILWPDTGHTFPILGSQGPIYP